jgi:ubiquinone/menaquinone biosynthesis C-methylase UbiE
MHRVAETSAGHAGQAVANDYDSFAEAYAAETESNLLNGHYARPAILDLAGNVAGRRILDAGCGAGPLLAALRDRGALVTGFDPSIKMLELARQRLGAGAALQRASLGGAPLPFPDRAFDDAIACLVLHYLEDWKAPLAELRRVLAPGGPDTLTSVSRESVILTWRRSQSRNFAPVKSAPVKLAPRNAPGRPSSAAVQLVTPCSQIATRLAASHQASMN